MTTPDAFTDVSCPRCGAPLQPGQDWCLNCGTAVSTTVAGPPGWRAPIAIVGVVLLLAAAALVYAFLQLSDNADEVAQAPARTPPAVVTGPSGPSGVVAPSGPSGPTGAIPPGSSPTPSPSPGTSATPTTTTKPPVVPSLTPIPGISPIPSTSSTPTPAPSTSSGSFASWPSGKHGWTVVMYSGTTRSAAEAKASNYQSQGKSVGILHSDDYSTLRPGYWVVFSGTYDSKSEAQNAAKGLQSTAPGAYAREVKPK